MATLKISDLSVGDWVRYKGEPSRVLDCGMLVVSATSISFEPHLTVQAKQDIFDSVNIEKIEPIPITAEILEKNGSIRCGTNGYSLYGTPFDLVYAGGGRWDLYATNSLEDCVWITEVNSLHQLQHIYRLAGVDKEINLLS